MDEMNTMEAMETIDTVEEPTDISMESTDSETTSVTGVATVIGIGLAAAYGVYRLGKDHAIPAAKRGWHFVKDHIPGKGKKQKTVVLESTEVDEDSEVISEE